MVGWLSSSSTRGGRLAQPELRLKQKRVVRTNATFLADIAGVFMVSLCSVSQNTCRDHVTIIQSSLRDWTFLLSFRANKLAGYFLLSLRDSFRGVLSLTCIIHKLLEVAACSADVRQHFGHAYACTTNFADGRPQFGILDSKHRFVNNAG